ncbi:MAG: DNA ligase-associated metallophosphoesterase [Rhodothermales bacterium]|jgi:DNA ligase-associated metallophosphoesterase
MDLSNALMTEVAGHRLALMPERAVFNLGTGDLYVADLHIGKSATFRSGAIPIPDGDTAADLVRLGSVIQSTEARRVVVLGDFLHAPASHLDQTWRQWRATCPDLEIVVVRGNHDVTAGDPGADWGVELLDGPVKSGSLVFQHHPEASELGYVLSGHLHPAIRLRGVGRDSILLPCFHVGEAVMVLPAFTSFSGGYRVVAGKKDRIFAIADDAVLDVTALAR